MTKICATPGCGKEFEVDPHKSGRKKHCDYCSIHVAHKKRGHGNQGNVYKKRVRSQKSDEPPTDCICPMCRKPHKKHGAHKWSYCRACEGSLRYSYSDAYGRAM